MQRIDTGAEDRWRGRHALPRQSRRQRLSRGSRVHPRVGRSYLMGQHPRKLARRRPLPGLPRHRAAAAGDDGTGRKAAQHGALPVLRGGMDHRQRARLDVPRHRKANLHARNLIVSPSGGRLALALGHDIRRSRDHRPLSNAGGGVHSDAEPFKTRFLNSNPKERDHARVHSAAFTPRRSPARL